MTARTVRRWPLALAVTAAALLGAGCMASSDRPDAPPPGSTASPAVGAPSPEFAPVTGTVTVALVDANRTAALHVAEPVATDRAAVDAFAADVTTWLDEHLTQLQRGEPGLLRGSALTEDAPADVVATVTTALADPDAVPVAARYQLTVATAGRPLWALVHVEVDHASDRGAAADFVFAPSSGGLVVVGAEPATAGAVS